MIIVLYEKSSHLSGISVKPWEYQQNNKNLVDYYGLVNKSIEIVEVNKNHKQEVNK